MKKQKKMLINHLVVKNNEKISVTLADTTTGKEQNFSFGVEDDGTFFIYPSSAAIDVRGDGFIPVNEKEQVRAIKARWK